MRKESYTKCLRREQHEVALNYMEREKRGLGFSLLNSTSSKRESRNFDLSSEGNPGGVLKPDPFAIIFEPVRARAAKLPRRKIPEEGRTDDERASALRDGSPQQIARQQVIAGALAEEERKRMQALFDEIGMQPRQKNKNRRSLQ